MRHCAALLSLVFLTSTSVLSQQALTGSIEGVVVRAGTGEPIADAQVSLTPFNIPGTGPRGGPLAASIVVTGGVAAGGAEILPAIAVPPPAISPAGVPPTGGPPQSPPRTFPSITTDGEGRFTFKDVPAGGYRVAATANGYARQEYAQRVLNAPGRPVFLAANQTFKDAAIQLTPTGPLTGRIFDESGQPATGAPVELLRSVYNLQGRTFQSVGTGIVDDRGEYRIFGVPPGRYYLSAGNPPGPARPRPGVSGVPSSAAGNPRYEYTFYPNVSDIEQAIPIEIRGGSETSMHMTIRRQMRTYRVSGKVIDAATGAPPPAINITMAYSNLTGGGGGFSSPNAYDPATGTFQMLNIAPGDYVIRAVEREQTPLLAARDAAGVEARRVAQAALASASAPAHVTDADIDGLVLTLRAGATAAGRIALEGQPLSSLGSLERMRLLLSPPLQMPLNQSPVATTPDANGVFQIVGLREGEYRAIITGMPHGFYVRSIEYDGEDILNKPFQFSGVGGGSVSVVLRRGAAQVTGTVTDSQSRVVPGIPVMLIPANRQRIDLYRGTIADQSGRFSFVNFPPGQYRAYSFDGIEQGAQFDPDFMQRYEQQGQSVVLAESSTSDINVRLITLP